jgi:hypothetical protein
MGMGGIADFGLWIAITRWGIFGWEGGRVKMAREGGIAKEALIKWARFSFNRGFSQRGEAATPGEF